MTQSFLCNLSSDLGTASHSTGARILSIEVEPDEGGLTRMKGGAACWTLPAGYLGSSFIGSLLVFAGFDTVASKSLALL
jgi:hypothetical protein